VHILLLRDGVVIQASYKGGEYEFYFSREGSVYFNIRGDGRVIQASLRGGECNLLKRKKQKIKIMGCLPFNTCLTSESRRSIGSLLFNTSFESLA